MQKMYGDKTYAMTLCTNTWTLAIEVRIKLSWPLAKKKS